MQQRLNAEGLPVVLIDPETNDVEFETPDESSHAEEGDDEHERNGKPIETGDDQAAEDQGRTPSLDSRRLSTSGSVL